MRLLEGRLEIVIAEAHSPPALHQAHTKLRSRIDELRLDRDIMRISERAAVMDPLRDEEI